MPLPGIMHVRVSRVICACVTLAFMCVFINYTALLQHEASRDNEMPALHEKGAFQKASLVQESSLDKPDVKIDNSLDKNNIAGNENDLNNLRSHNEKPAIPNQIEKPIEKAQDVMQGLHKNSILNKQTIRKSDDNNKANLAIKTGSLNDLDSNSPDDCPQLTRPDRKQETFQPVGDRKVFVFSAYADHRKAAGGPKIRIIASGYQQAYNHIGDLYCQLWYSQDTHVDTHGDTVGVASQPIVTKATYKVIYKSTLHHDEWTAHFVLCPISEQRKGMPIAVSVTPELCSVPQNYLLIQNRAPPGPLQPPSFAVCLAPIYGRYKDWVGLIEMFEMYTILGASEIVIYNISLSAETESAIQMYRKEKRSNSKLTVIQWHIPMDKMTTISYFLQRVSLNDCLYRLAHSHTLVAIHDIDEVMVPRLDYTWHELFTRIYDPEVAIYMFQHSYFRRNTSSEDPYSIIQSSLWTTEKVIPAGKIRCKSMYNALLTEMIDVHYHYELLPKAKEFMIPPDIAKLHHYRNGLMETFRKDQSIVFIEDRHMVQYNNELMKHFKPMVLNIRSKLGK